MFDTVRRAFRYFRLNNDFILRGPKGTQGGKPVCPTCHKTVLRGEWPCNACGLVTHAQCQIVQPPNARTRSEVVRGYPVYRCRNCWAED